MFFYTKYQEPNLPQLVPLQATSGQKINKSGLLAESSSERKPRNVRKMAGMSCWHSQGTSPDCLSNVVRAGLSNPVLTCTAAVSHNPPTDKGVCVSSSSLPSAARLPWGHPNSVYVPASHKVRCFLASLPYFPVWVGWEWPLRWHRLQSQEKFVPDLW